MRRSADGATHGMAYDGVSPGDALLYDGAGAIAYTPGVARTSYASGKTLYTNVDALGSVHDTETDGSGGPADVLRTEAFGTTLTASSEPDALSLGWGASSYQTDSDTGLTLLGNRYYDAPEGRFVSPDPAGDGDNWYEYCGNDPLTHVDPTGKAAVDPAHWGTLLDGVGALADSLAEGNAYQSEDVLTQLDQQMQRNQQTYDAQQSDGPFMFGIGDTVNDGIGGPVSDWVSFLSNNKTEGAAATGVSAYFGAMSQMGAVKSVLASADAFTGDAGYSFVARGILIDNAGTLASFGLPAGLAMAASGYVGWHGGTYLSNLPLGPGGQTVTDFWVDEFSGLGTWAQEHTSFGH